MISTFWSYQTVQPSFMSKWQQSNSSGFLNVMQWFQCHALFSLKLPARSVQFSQLLRCRHLLIALVLRRKITVITACCHRLQKNLYTRPTISSFLLLSFSSNLIIMANISFNSETQSVHACVKFQRKDHFIVASISSCIRLCYALFKINILLV